MPPPPVTLARSDAGAGGRPLLLVHGFTGARIDFADWMEPLAAAGWHVVAVDNRGHGETGGPDDVDAYTFDAFVDDLVAVADELGWDRFVLLGHSLGGMIAQRFALDHPCRLDALVLMDTAHGPVSWMTPDEVELGVAYARSDGMGALYDLIASLRDEVVDVEETPGAQPERLDLVEQDRAKFAATVPAMFEAGAHLMMEAPDRLEQLRSIEVRTLVVVGEFDTPFLDDSRRMADAIRGATLAVIPGAGHSPQRETPDAWWLALSRFLDGLDVPDAPGDRPPTDR